MSDTHVQNNTIQHLSYLCPGLHDKNSQQHVERKTFRCFLKENKRLIIPLIQRRYCWNDRTISAWFNDVVRGKRDHLGHHNTGNIVVKHSNQDKGTIIIDGQQRITATLLLLSALKDAILEEEESIREQNPNRDYVVRGNIPSDRDYVVRGNIPSDPCEQLLKSTLEENVLDLIDSILFTNSYEKVPSLNEGDDFSHSRLLPSFRDRKVFFELITNTYTEYNVTTNTADADNDINDDTITNNALTHTVANDVSVTSSNTAMDIRNIVASNQNMVTSRNNIVTNTKTVSNPESNRDISFQEKTKKLFRTYIDKVCLPNNPKNKMKLLTDFTIQAIDKMSLTLVTILTPIDLSQVFLWLQEKSLFSAGGILYNPTPGVNFTATDLIRNLTLSPLMNQKLNIQERFYREYWLDDIEIKFQNIDDLNKKFDEFVNDRRKFVTHISNFEQVANKMASSKALQGKVTGLSNIFIYGKYLSIFEHVDGRLQKRKLFPISLLLSLEGLTEVQENSLHASMEMLKDFKHFMKKN